MAKKNALGRGLDALIDSGKDTAGLRKEANEINIDLIDSNPFQPRTKFDEESLKDMASSIRELGVIQPITVCVLPDKRFQLISGERRLRASKIAGLTRIPAYIRTANDQEKLEMALVENIQREDLDAIEIAISYKRLMNECSLTQEELSTRIGKNRSTIANYIRLLNLPANIQLGIRENKISMGHARALLAIEEEDTQLMIFKQILKYDFSVRKVEEVVRQLMEEKKTEKNTENKKVLRTQKEYDQLQKHLSNFFAADVVFKRNIKGNGKIVIPFKNDMELERIIAILDKMNS